MKQKLPLTAIIDDVDPSLTSSSFTLLVESVKTDGVRNPILVRPEASTPGRYRIVDGRARFRAALVAGLTEIPLVVIDMSEKEADAHARWANYSE